MHKGGSVRLSLHTVMYSDLETVASLRIYLHGLALLLLESSSFYDLVVVTVHRFHCIMQNEVLIPLHLVHNNYHY